MVSSTIRRAAAIASRASLDDRFGGESVLRLLRASDGPGAFGLETSHSFVDFFRSRIEREPAHRAGNIVRRRESAGRR